MNLTFLKYILLELIFREDANKALYFVNVLNSMEAF